MEFSTSQTGAKENEKNNQMNEEVSNKVNIEISLLLYKYYKIHSIYYYIKMGGVCVL